MIERKMIGEKTGQGFYKRVKTADGDSEILTLDPATLEYRPRKSPRLPSLEAAPPITDVRRARADALRRQGQGRRVPARHARPTLAYTAQGHAARSPTRQTTSIG